MLADRSSAQRPWRRMASSSSAPTEPVKPDVERLRRQPAKVIPDYLAPMPSHLLTTVLSDLEWCGTNHDAAGGEAHIQSSQESSPIVQSPPLPLPQGHHLVYFPIQAAPSQLASDGADLDHSPGTHYSRRLWAGGEVTFRGGGGDSARPHRSDLVMDGRPWTCTESIGDVRVKGSSAAAAAGTNAVADEKVFVDVWRRYALGHPVGDEVLPWSIEERRTLVFMNPGEEHQAKDAAVAPRIIKCERIPAHSCIARQRELRLTRFKIKH